MRLVYRLRTGHATGRKRTVLGGNVAVPSVTYRVSRETGEGRGSHEGDSSWTTQGELGGGGRRTEGERGEGDKSFVPVHQGVKILD